MVVFAFLGSVRSLDDEGVEGARGERGLEATGGVGRVGELERAFVLQRVLGHDHDGAVRIAEGDGHGVEVAGGAEHLRAGAHVLGEVAHHVVFGVVAHLVRVGGDGEQGVLARPRPADHRPGFS